jgi:hypothetical protein
MKMSFDSLLAKDAADRRNIHAVNTRLNAKEYDKLNRLCLHYNVGSFGSFVRALIQEKYIETFGEKE